MCAVKKIKDFERSALAEVKVMMDLDHKHIVKLIGHHLEDEGTTLCIAMEFADRGTFEAYITAQAMKPTTVWFEEHNVWRCLHHLATGLDYLHTLQPNPILHRDLKPENVLGFTLSDNRVRWKLADFGLARLMTENTQGKFYAHTREVGTPHYMAPEVKYNRC